MPIAQLYQSSATISTTEFSIPNGTTYVSTAGITTSGVYQPFLDTSAQLVGMTLQIRVYERVTSSSAQRVVYEAFLTGAMTDTWVSPSLTLMNGWDVTLKQTTSSATIHWSIRRVS